MAKKESKNQGVKLAIRQAGVGGITKQELNNITKSTGASAQTVVKRLDSVNQNLKSNERTGINLNSGAVNMLIKEAGPAYGGFYGLTQKPTFGTGRIGQALEGMRGTRASGGYQNPQSGYGSVTPGTDRRFMMGGTAIRPGGRETVRGFGKQYSLPEQDKKVIKNPIGGVGYVPNQVNNDQTVQDPVTEDPVTTDPVASTSDPGPGMMAGGGLGALGANKLNRAKSRLRQLGIYGRGTGLLGRGLQYGNSLNTGR